MVERNTDRQWWSWGFFIDAGGVLSYQPRPIYPVSPKPITKLQIDENTWYELIDGLWFWVERADEETLAWRKLLGISRQYLEATKRQVGKKTLKKIRKELSNGAGI